MEKFYQKAALGKSPKAIFVGYNMSANLWLEMRDEGMLYVMMCAMTIMTVAMLAGKKRAKLIQYSAAFCFNTAVEKGRQSAD